MARTYRTGGATPKVVLAWKDGRRQETPFTGANQVIVPWQKEGRDYETSFMLDDYNQNVWTYAEVRTKDTTEAMQKARDRIETRRWEVVRRGLGSKDCTVRSCKCSCHATQRHGEEP